MRAAGYDEISCCTSPNERGKKLATTKVEVEVESGISEAHDGLQNATQESGAFDLRLFRDGQLVGYFPESGGRIELDEHSKRTSIRFNVALPSSPKSKNVELSAYAFNEDRVKSLTNRVLFQ